MLVKWFVMTLLVLLIICIIRLFRMKKDIQSLEKSLNYIYENNTNQQLTTNTFYKEISNLSNTMNKILDKYVQIRISSTKSNREFQQVITNISHDLRTPLTSAIGYTQMIQSDKADEQKKLEYIQIIEYRLKVLSNLTNNLLEYSRLIEEVTPLNNEKINLNNLLRDVVSTFYDQFSDKGYQVSLDISNEVLYFIGDVSLFERIFMNLIQNALLYGTETFEVSLDADTGILEFKNRIEDPQDTEVEKILERFYTADKSRSNKSVGLGLAIVKELITKMNGTIDASMTDDFLCIRIYLINKNTG